MPLLKQIDAAAQCVDIFTTNYDLVLEKAIDRAGLNVKCGYVDDGATRELEIEAWQEDRVWTSETKGLLTKLHGSVHWVKGQNGDIEIGGASSKDYSRQVALYPGYKGVPSEEPFKSFHDHLARKLARADIILVLGLPFEMNTLTVSLEQERRMANAFF